MDNYNKAFTEVYTVLNYLNKDEYNKIPKEILQVIEENRNIDYNYQMNRELDLDKQEMLPETEAILFNLFRDYLSTPEQKEKIIRMQKEERAKNEERKKEQYKKIEMFKQKEFKQNKDTVECLELINVKKENIFIRILNKIKRIFKK